jgi:hypothetical protein
MHTLIMKDVHGAVFGELKNEESGKQAAAKRLGLLNFADAFANSNQVSLKKLSKVEKAANATKIETEELKREIERLHVVRQQAEEINNYARSWLSEAWDHVIDEFWPHGAPTDESIGQQADRTGSGTGTGGCNVMDRTDPSGTGIGGCNVMDRTGSGTGTGGCTVMDRTDPSGTGIGGCNVMDRTGASTGTGGCTVMDPTGASTGTGGCNVMSTEMVMSPEIIQAGRTGSSTGTGACNVTSTNIVQAGRTSASTGTGACNVMSTDIYEAGRGGQAGTGTGGCLVM